MEFLWFLSTLRNPILNTLMVLISYIGTPFAVVGIITWFYYNVDKKVAYGMTFSFFVSTLLCQGLKLVFRVPRPWVLDPDFQAVPEAVTTAGGYSFPSIHTQGSTAIYVSLCYFYKKKSVRTVCILLLGLIAFSRMYLGCHTPLDVGTAFGLTLILTLIVCRWWNGAAEKTGSGRPLAVFIAVFASGVLILDSVLYHGGIVDYSNAKDAFETCGIAFGFVLGFFLERKYIHFRIAVPVSRKILRFALGIAVALGIEFGIKAFSGNSTVLMTLRYFLMLVWIEAVWPLVFTRFEQKKVLEKKA